MKTRKPKKRRGPSEWPAIVYLSGFGLALFVYTVARLVLDGRPHPYHWLAGLAGGVAGAAIGWIWYRAKGDVF